MGREIRQVAASYIERGERIVPLFDDLATSLDHLREVEITRRKEFFGAFRGDRLKALGSATVVFSKVVVMSTKDVPGGLLERRVLKRELGDDFSRQNVAVLAGVDPEELSKL